MKFLLAVIFLVQTHFVFGFNDSDHPQYLEGAQKVEALWSQYLSEGLDPVVFFSAMESLRKADKLKQDQLGTRDRLRLLQIKNAFLGNAKISLAIAKVDSKTAMQIVSEREFYTNLNLSFAKGGQASLEKARLQLEKLQKFRPKTRKEIVDLVYEAPGAADYQNGEYGGGVKLFLFCRRDRSYPCLFVMKDAFDRLVRNENGEMWTLPGLALSASGLPYYQTNGQTPSGVHSMDSVMPKANRQMAFGKFRRVILNWIPNDQLTSSLLPESAKDKNWWKEASLARNNGRKWLRIHGTGRKNDKPGSHYYPHMPTAGCISTREGNYGDISFIDQKIILDELMRAMQLAPVYSNQVKIKGFLYVIELDKRKAPVSASALREYGIH